VDRNQGVGIDEKDKARIDRSIGRLARSEVYHLECRALFLNGKKTGDKMKKAEGAEKKRM
jgi:hypothetical protein